MISAATKSIFPISKDAFSFNKRLFFAFLSLLLFLNAIILNEFIRTEDLYYSTYGEQVAMERIKELVDMVNKWQWLGYVLIPVILAVKISFTAICLNIGTIFAGLKIGFKKLFKIALIAETVFVLAAITRNISLAYFIDVQTLTDIQHFYPFSLMNLFNPYDLPNWIIYPLQALNIFELIYWIALGLGLSLVLNKKFSSTFGLVLSSYGVGLLVWMVFVVFLSINIS